MISHLTVQLQRAGAERGKLAANLEATLRDLEQAHGTLREREQQRMREIERDRMRAQHEVDHTGLMHDLAHLQYKLYGQTAPVLDLPIGGEWLPAASACAAFAGRKGGSAVAEGFRAAATRSVSPTSVA